MNAMLLLVPGMLNDESVWRDVLPLLGEGMRSSTFSNTARSSSTENHMRSQRTVSMPPWMTTTSPSR